MNLLIASLSCNSALHVNAISHNIRTLLSFSKLIIKRCREEVKTCPFQGPAIPDFISPKLTLGAIYIQALQALLNDIAS